MVLVFLLTLKAGTRLVGAERYGEGRTAVGVQTNYVGQVLDRPQASAQSASLTQLSWCALANRGWSKGIWGLCSELCPD